MRERFLEEVELALKPGESLAVSFAMLGSGLDRIIVERDSKDVVRVRATSGPAGGRFAFGSQRNDSEQYTYSIRRIDAEVGIGDILRSKFWGQFTLGELTTLRRSRKLRSRLARILKKLAGEFESNAVERLNALVELPRFRKSAR